MPILDQSPEASRIRVTPSAPLELMWLVHNCEAKHPLTGPLASLEPISQGLGTQLWSFWGDGVRGFTEAVVLAERGGTMLDGNLDRFFSGLDAVASAGTGSASLLSESPAERRAIETRLKRLHDDSDLRRRYRALLMSLWDQIRGEWESEGREAVAVAAADWIRRLDEGADYHAILERSQVWPGRPALEELASSAAAEGRLVLSPGWFFGEIHVVELDGTVYLGGSIRGVDYEAMLRETAIRVAGSLKALADPTRVGILLWLARHPTSVTELARHFDLSQPTVSAHIQLLREAGLIEEKPSGRSSLLSVVEQRLKNLFGEAESSLLRMFPG